MLSHPLFDGRKKKHNMSQSAYFLVFLHDFYKRPAHIHPTGRIVLRIYSEKTAYMRSSASVMILFPFGKQTCRLSSPVLTGRTHHVSDKGRMFCAEERSALPCAIFPECLRKIPENKVPYHRQGKRLPAPHACPAPAHLPGAGTRLQKCSMHSHLPPPYRLCPTRRIRPPSGRGSGSCARR